MSGLALWSKPESFEARHKIPKPESPTTQTLQTSNTPTPKTLKP